MKKTFEKPELTIILLPDIDTLVVSGTGGGNEYGDPGDESQDPED